MHQKMSLLFITLVIRLKKQKRSQSTVIGICFWYSINPEFSTETLALYTRNGKSEQEITPFSGYKVVHKHGRLHDGMRSVSNKLASGL